jgi:hypothetical protein
MIHEVSQWTPGAPSMIRVSGCTPHRVAMSPLHLRRQSPPSVSRVTGRAPAAPARFPTRPRRASTQQLRARHGARGARARNCRSLCRGHRRRVPDGRGLCLALSLCLAAFGLLPHLCFLYSAEETAKPRRRRFWWPDSDLPLLRFAGASKASSDRRRPRQAHAA